MGINYFLACNLATAREGGRRMKVKVRNGNVEQALRVFRKKITESNVLFDYRENQYHEKKTTKRQRKQAAAKQRERKRQCKDIKY